MTDNILQRLPLTGASLWPGLFKIASS